MRAVFIGASTLAIRTAQLLLARGHEVVLIERDKERIEALTSELDCGFLQGDGNKPDILREANPSATDLLFCLTGDDQTNILASLVGRSLGFKRVVTKIDDPSLEHICIELGLEDTIIPSRTIGRFLADLFEGHDPLQLSAMVREEARVFTFVVKDEDEEKSIAALDLPASSRVVCIYRKGKFIAPDDETKLKLEDEVVIITHSKQLSKLLERWMPRAHQK